LPADWQRLGHLLAAEDRQRTAGIGARVSIHIADDFAKAIGRRFTVLVESLTGGVPITVDCARDQSRLQFLDAGGAAPAARIH
jgi:hypothetical protein